MKSLIFLSVMFISNATCKEQVEEKVLIKTYYKKIEHGYFYFILQKSNSSYKQLSFSYDINVKDSSVNISLLKDEEITLLEDVGSYLQSGKWNKKQKGTYREKYYTLIHEKFLDMTNLQKIEILKKCSTNHE
ncbi:MAG: hypothetical protein J5I47_10945 [Vicingus serpentipes]|nr:hypothetical protein [Vicingus serpentipes]